MKTIEELGISPAPWKTYIGVYSFWVDDNAGEFVCMKSSNSMNDRNIGKRNARLIAAAPDLYKALRGLLEIVCGDCNSAYKVDGKCVKCPRVVAAEAALAKAGGAE